MGATRDLLKHSWIYGIGQILGRFASVLLLPLYTRCLSPADYGCVAILDLTTGILAILIGSAMGSAITRFHFDADSEAQQNRVWWTGVTYVGLSATGLVLPLWFVRQWLADVTLGVNVVNGATFYTLALATLWLGTIGEIFATFLRVKKWSGIFVVISLGRLLLNIGLNVYFLVGLKWGIAGLLTGNLIATATSTVVMFAAFRYGHTSPVFDRQTVWRLLQFGSPLIVTALLSLLMHEADRYFLRVYGDMTQVGTYSVAYKVAQAVATLCLVPFTSIWSVVLYEMANQPDAKRQYAALFEKFVSAILIIMLATSLFAGPILPLLTGSAYADAVNLIPIVLLAFVFFSLHQQFHVPALLAKKTLTLVPASIAAVIVNFTMNILLIPRFGAAGAAWTSLATYATYSFVGLAIYRRIDIIPYPFRRCTLALLGVVGSYLVFKYFLEPNLTLGARLAVATACCLSWTGILFGGLLKHHWPFLQIGWPRMAS